MADTEGAVLCVWCGGGADLVGAELAVDVRLLADAVLQVRHVGLQPVPVADYGGPIHRVAPLRTSPSVRQSEEEEDRVRAEAGEKGVSMSV